MLLAGFLRCKAFRGQRLVRPSASIMPCRMGSPRGNLAYLAERQTTVAIALVSLAYMICDRC